MAPHKMGREIEKDMRNKPPANTLVQKKSLSMEQTIYILGTDKDKYSFTSYLCNLAQKVRDHRFRSLGDFEENRLRINARWT